jgi:hypothetical protein
MHGYIKGRNDCDFMLSIYTALLAAFSDIHNVEKYNNYKKLLEANIHRLNKDEISFHYTVLLSYCILNEQSGGYKNIFSEELLNLYETIFKNEYYKNKKENYSAAEIIQGYLFLAKG